LEIAYRANAASLELLDNALVERAQSITNLNRCSGGS